MQEILSDWRSAPINAQLRAMLGLLEQATLDPDSVTPDDVRPVFAAGASKQAIEDALRICACFNLISRLADAFDVTIPSAEGFTQTGIQLIAHGYL